MGRKRRKLNDGTAEEMDLAENLKIQQVINNTSQVQQTAPDLVQNSGQHIQTGLQVYHTGAS